MPMYISCVSTSDGYTNTSQSDIVYATGGTPTSYVPSTMNEKEILFFTDQEDINIRIQATSGALDEFFQANMQNNMSRCLSTQECSLTVMPKYLDTISQDAIAQETTGNIAEQINSLPKPSTWFSTKVYTSDSVSGTVELNLNQKFLGLKYYVFDIYNTNTATNSYEIGRLCFTYNWEFRNLDNRALVTTISIVPKTDEETKKRVAAKRLSYPMGKILKSHPGGKPMTKLARLVADVRLRQSDTPLSDPNKRQKLDEKVLPPGPPVLARSSIHRMPFGLGN